VAATLPITIALSRPVKDGSRTLSEVCITRRRSGADLRAESRAESTDHAGLIEVQRAGDMLPSTPEAMANQDVNAVLAAIASAGDEPAEIEAWPYVLRFPTGDLTEIKRPREAIGKDARIVGRVAGDCVPLRMIAWVELLCGLTRAEFDALDACDAEALCLGVVPFYAGSPIRPSASAFLLGSPSPVPGSPRS